MTTVKDILAKKSVFITLSQTEFPEVRDAHSGIILTQRKYQKEVFVLDVYQYWNNILQLVSFDETGKMNYIYVPQETQIEVQDKVIDKAYFQKILPNLRHYVGHSFMVGADPEIFVVDKNDNLLPAFEFLPAKPGPELDRSRLNVAEYPAYWDGFQAEFETQPRGCLGYHTDHVQYGLKNILTAARKKDKKARLSIKTVMNIPQELLDNGKEEHVQFGCMPSLNVYGMEGNKRDGRSVPFRPVGGHLHFGVGNSLTEEAIVKGIKAMDAIIAVACVSFFAKLDDPRRRTLYGLAGEYRRPKHGVEYRTLSNAWLCHPVVTHLTFDLARKAFMFGAKGFFDVCGWTADEKKTIEVINTCNVEEARKILVENRAIYLTLLQACYGDMPRCEAAFSAFCNGVESIISDPTNIEKNWDLEGSWRTHCGNTDKMFSNAYNNTLCKGKKIA